MPLLVELFLDAKGKSLLVSNVMVRKIPPRGELLERLPVAATKAVTASLEWTEMSLNECEQTPFTCAKQSNGTRARSRCPACRIRKALGMPALAWVRP